MSEGAGEFRVLCRDCVCLKEQGRLECCVGIVCV